MSSFLCHEPKLCRLVGEGSSPGFSHSEYSWLNCRLCLYCTLQYNVELPSPPRRSWTRFVDTINIDHYLENVLLQLHTSEFTPTLVISKSLLLVTGRDWGCCSGSISWGPL